MATNKVVYGNNTLIDLTNDSVSSESLLEGETAHDRSGAQITGSLRARHTILNNQGQPVPARSNLQFGKSIVTDDSTNDITKVNVNNAIEKSYAEFQNLTPSERADGSVYYIPDYPTLGNVFFFRTVDAMQAAIQHGDVPNNAICITTADYPYEAKAEDVTYDNTDSGLEADNVQDAVDEINGNFIRTYPPFVRNDNLITANTFEEFIIGGIQLLKLRDLLIEEGDITKTMLGWRGRGWFEFEIDVLNSGTEFYILVKSLQEDVDIYTNIKDIDDTLQINSISYSCRNETYFANSTERRIGKWMNGKPLYKKIIPITIPACVEEGTEVSNFSEAVSNEAISVISFYGFYTNTYGNVETIPNGSAVRNIFHTQSKAIITYNKAPHNNNCSGYCIVKYTKNNE